MVRGAKLKDNQRIKRLVVMLSEQEENVIIHKVAHSEFEEKSVWARNKLLQD